MKTLLRVGAAAMVVAASTACALGDAPPRHAAGAQLDDATIKQQQVNWELANGIVPTEGGGVAMRGVCPNSVSRTPNLPIPQFVAPNPGVVTDQITTSGDPLSNVRVQLIIPHTWQGDVIARLRHDASGTEVVLIDRPGVPQVSTVGFSADNYGDNANGIPFVLDNSAFSRYDNPDVAAPGTANVTGNWLADDQFSSLAAFNGLTANTTWTLTVSDNAALDSGTLVRWTICSDNALGQNFPTGVGAASPNPTTSGSLVTFTVQVSPAVGPPSTGLAVVTDLFAAGGSSSQAFFDNGTNGDAVPGDNVFTYQTVVTAGSGVLSLPFVVSDAEARSSGGTIGLTLVATNDFCESAINVPVGSSIISTNEGATNDPGLPTCSGLLTFNLGVWFTTTGTGNIIDATTCSPNTTLNTRMYVYTGFCGGFTCVGAATATTPACSPSTAASVRFCSNLGETYYILITNDTTGTGQFELSVLDGGACPQNDNCPGDVVTAPSSTLGSTIGLTPSGVTSCGANSADAYYQFTPVFSGSYTIDTCGSSFDTRLSIFTDCPAFSQVGCNDDACGLQSRLILELSAGTTYYIRVSAFGATVTGNFVLNISAPPIPSGGCCIAGNCSVQLQPDCASLGGSYLGDNAPCVMPGPNEFSYTSNPFLAIPDAACTTLGFSTDSIFVPDSFTVGDVNVRVQITHTFVGDLRIRLTNGATTVAVWERVCGTNENMDVTFDDQGATLVCSAPVFGAYIPSGTGAGSLSSFNGQGSSGTWTLEVCDGAGLDLGTLDSWTLILRDSGENPCGGGPQFCDADWCQDGSVGVPDIFCFLSAWFANDPEARNYGGTNGVPAIFAFLSIWFATGTGPCTP